ncbi:hypothetical protein NDU88_009418 [Pleurodeles waltl]|uniref:Uncharacterized protein n=1 Tax=Pleurodeles waltl TaxID=8319 RepID=A0AAV7QUH3_PLEWA|nr:hypothetical protein NDU88_009418 [Pleurodeles waltl]
MFLCMIHGWEVTTSHSESVLVVSLPSAEENGHVNSNSVTVMTFTVREWPPVGVTAKFCVLVLFECLRVCKMRTKVQTYIATRIAEDPAVETK